MLKDKFEKEISVLDLFNLDPKDYVLVDVRSEFVRTINNAVNMSDIVLMAQSGELDKSKSYILFKDKRAYEEVDILQDLGYDAINLKGGYLGYLRDSLNTPYEDRQYKAEHSIIKTYRKELLTPFLKALDKYEMIKEGDKIAVCISGGKDSMLLAKLFQELHKFTQIKFDLEFICMDPGYNQENRNRILENAKILGIPLNIFETKIFDSVDKVEDNPCYLCARMRRGHLYSYAKKIGCNKIALGHHYDDVIETILMGMMYGAQIQTMMPKLKSDNFENMELIRPMYLVREKDVQKWSVYNDLHFIQCGCHFKETCWTIKEDDTAVSKRLEIKRLIQNLKNTNPFIEQNIFKSVENVCLDAVISYKKDDIRHHFLDTYDDD